MRENITAPEVLSALDEIERAGNRAADLTRRLLAFSRKQIMRPVVCDLNEVTANASAMLKRIIGEHIVFSVKLTTEAVWVRTDPSQIEQVLMNLIVNARDAMPSGGRLTVQISLLTHSSADKALAESLPVGRYAVLSVTDTGCGMDEQTQSRVFEPFFTTKSRDKGTGLGLATVYGIVKQTGGFIYSRSAVGQGTTFTVFLPIEPDGKRVDVDRATPSPAATGTETILLVEDEDGVRNLVRQVLTRRGFNVLCASNAEQAQQLFRERAYKVDLLVTDVIMPGIKGPALVQSLLVHSPELRVLYMSGYAEEGLFGENRVSPDEAFLAKPFTPSALAGKVREVLNSPIPVRPPAAVSNAAVQP